MASACDESTSIESPFTDRSSGPPSGGPHWVGPLDPPVSEVYPEPPEIGSSHISMRRRQLSSASATVLAFASISGGYVFVVPILADCLGLTLGFLLFLLFHITSFFVSFLLYKLHLAYRDALAETWGDLFAQLYGLKAGVIGWGALFLAIIVWLCNMVSQYIVIVEEHKPLAIDIRIIYAISALLVLPGSQIRNSRRLLPIAVSCTVATILLSVLTSLGTVAGRLEPMITSGHSQSHIFLMKQSLAVMLVTPTAFSGQLLFLGIQAEMQEPVRFLRSLQIVYLVHLACSAVIFGSILERFGDRNVSTQQAITNYFTTCSRLYLVRETLKFIYLMTSYCIYQRVLARELTVWLFPLAVGEGWKARLCWFGMTATVIGILSVAMLLLQAKWIPYSNPQTVVVNSFAFIFPCLLYLKSRNHRLFESSRVDVVVTVACYGMLISWFLIILVGFAIWAHFTP
eukprot:TRINITY_DN18992_c0_g1_i1.p1 TRINITY_DN18992_c0_g1~~TRINITY_DN18992_c0_g1_i1.p1  ORF type:complete len:457 (-),score=23.91 TRINITY_DN18992_c0_g1_i1:243-1613(-)